MNCAEFIEIIKSGQPIIFRRHSREYIRLSSDSLSVISENGTHLCLWLAAIRHFKRILRSLDPSWGAQGVQFRETLGFLYRWEEMREVRRWGPNLNFPALREIATFVYLTLVPEYWTIYLEREGQPLEEALPLIEHESLHTDTGGYDL
jgi:hypothetical protein